MKPLPNKVYNVKEAVYQEKLPSKNDSYQSAGRCPVIPEPQAKACGTVMNFLKTVNQGHHHPHEVGR